MIRFCDGEVDCVEYSALTRLEMLNYFLADHKEDLLCVYDDFKGMKYLGIITYRSFQRSINVDDAIQKEYVVWDGNLWENARKYFKKRDQGWLLPVLNEKYQLICFAYEDEDANREIRQLCELSESKEALQFSDIYPEYKFVKIHGFNELAYYFANYLRGQNIAVQVEGDKWQGFFVGEECFVPEYECLNIYAEGVWSKKHNWRENLLRSVSVEFECIDNIYEENIRNNIIRDSKGGYVDLLGHLRKEKEIIILGTGREAQNAYDILFGSGIDISCFVAMEFEESAHRIFGKKIISEIEARHIYQKPVFINCTAKNSAWGFGNVDYYDYIGYKRNERFILLRDYIEIPENNLLSILRTTNVVLLGDIYLCRRLYYYFNQKKVPVIGYLSVFKEDAELQGMAEVDIEDIDEEAMCLVIDPVYNIYVKGKRRVKEGKKQRIEYLVENHIDNYTDYFSDMLPFINMEHERDDKYTKKWLIPKRIVLGSIEPLSGNAFFRGLLDSHPTIAMMHYSELNNNLFWICICLSMVEKADILLLLHKMLEESELAIFNSMAFEDKMKELLADGSRFTSEELFVMLHIAYMSMYGNNIKKNEIRNMIIYWEPHFVQRGVLEDCVKWLGTEEMPCDIINVVRNACVQRGSMLKTGIAAGAKDIRDITIKVLRYPTLEKRDYKYGDRLVVKFEDLKCNARETLEIICKRWEIVWSDILLRTTCHGEKNFWYNGESQVSGFDLGPVYNTYEKFFSEYDRHRIMITSAPWQRKYGYPYVELTRFTRRELQEMFLREFRFEKLKGMEWCGDELDDRLTLQAEIRYWLQKTRMLEVDY